MADPGRYFTTGLRYIYTRTKAYILRVLFIIIIIIFAIPSFFNCPLS